MATIQSAATVVPMALVSRCIGLKIWVLMKDSGKEIVGTLRRFDDFMNLVLDGVKEITYTANGTKQINLLDSILLNGRLIAMLVPGGEPEEK